MAGLGAEPCLARGDRPERGEDLVEGHAGRDLRLSGAPARIAASAAAMHRRVLPDLERGEVEPERPELPAQLRDLAPGGAAQALGDERVGDLGQLRVELLGRARTGRSAAPPRRPGTTRVRRSRSAMNPKRWRYGSSGKRRRSWRSVSGRSSASRARREASGRATRSVVGRGRDRLHQPRRDGLVAAQDVVGLDPQRALGDLRGHARVAVAVPADPAPEPQERPDAWRPRPRPAAVRGGPGRAPVGGSSAASSAR